MGNWGRHTLDRKIKPFGKCDLTTSEDLEMVLLHGTLHATVFEADSLVQHDRAAGGAPKFFRKVGHENRH
ncbi:hypothetical protein Scep_026636 [Stephania cephalantha]|uniref:Uncharacterized protein n=1 Tax=Stephania cephalantha TaxID=152367 RepID=A0AAP0ENP5_9MAGN